jgi:N-acetylmuramoyl-L-alanine amidase
MRWIDVAAALGMAAMATAGLAQSPATSQAQPPPAVQMPQSPGMPAVPAPVIPQPMQPPPFVVVVDAAHGGSDTGARLSGGVEEKEITLGIAGRLRSTLHARGIVVVTTRQADVNLMPVDRAQIANRAQGAACLTIHATATGSGVHLFTSSLSPTGNSRFLPWPTAQSAYVTQSLKLESEIDSALAHTQIPVSLGRASVEPMDSLTCPEVAVEVAPLVGGHVTEARPVTDAVYQKSVVDAVAAALEQWRSDWKQ